MNGNGSFESIQNYNKVCIPKKNGFEVSVHSPAKKPSETWQQLGLEWRVGISVNIYPISNLCK
jgi:hypothetical protein